MWRSEDFKYQSWSSTLFEEGALGLSYIEQSHWSRDIWEFSCLSLILPQDCRDCKRALLCLAFYVDPGDLNSDSHVCMVSALVTEASLEIFFFSFKKLLIKIKFVLWQFCTCTRCIILILTIALPHISLSWCTFLYMHLLLPILLSTIVPNVFSILTFLGFDTWYSYSGPSVTHFLTWLHLFI